MSSITSTNGTLYQVGSAWWSDPIFYFDCKRGGGGGGGGAKFYLFAQNYEKWRSNFYIFTPNYEKLRSKVAKISKLPKREKKGGEGGLNSTKNSEKKPGIKSNSTAGWKGVCVSIPRSLPTNFTFKQCPLHREWFNACHIPPRVCLRCIGCLEYLLAINRITYVQPTNSIIHLIKIDDDIILTIKIQTPFCFYPILVILQTKYDVVTGSVFIFPALSIIIISQLGAGALAVLRGKNFDGVCGSGFRSDTLG